MPDLSEILKAALGLDVRDRARLAEELLASLDGLPEEEIERLWADEAEKRLQEFRARRVSAIPADEVAQKARRLIR
jgi:putative addiction module component (TIGR02574 family)